MTDKRAMKNWAFKDLSPDGAFRREGTAVLRLSDMASLSVFYVEIISEVIHHVFSRSLALPYKGGCLDERFPQSSSYFEAPRYQG